MDIETKLEELAEVRYTFEQAKVELDLLLDKLKQTPEWIKAAERAEDARVLIEPLEAELRTAALQSYAETGNKKPYPHLSIREVTRLEYDADIAIAWCMHRLPKALKLDTRMFEKHVRAVSETDPVGIAKVTKEPQATIATDLSSYLNEF